MKQLKEARQIVLAFRLLFSLGVCCINELKSGPCVYIYIHAAVSLDIAQISTFLPI